MECELTEPRIFDHFILINMHCSSLHWV